MRFVVVALRLGRNPGAGKPASISTSEMAVVWMHTYVPVGVGISRLEEDLRSVRPNNCRELKSGGKPFQGVQARVATTTLHRRHSLR